MAGRNLKVVENNKKNLTKEEIEAREEAEKKAIGEFKELQKTAPRHLDSIARYEYERVLEEVKRLPVRNIDRAVFEQYCTWYSVYRKAEADVKKYGIFLHIEDPNTKEHVIYTHKKNPAITVMKEATSEIKSCASLLGMTVDSRLRIYMPPKNKEKEASIFDKFGG